MSRAAAIRVVANPAGGRGRVRARWEEIAAACRRRGVTLEASSDALDLVERAVRAAREGCERLVVIGGDGTAHWAIQGLAQSGTALGIVPLGSGNDLALEIGMPADWRAALAVACEGPVEPIDLLRIAREDPPESAWVGCVAGVGFDSEVNRYANGIRRLRGRAIYIAAVLRVLARFRPLAIRVEAEGFDFQGRAMFVVFANASRYGGGMRIAPRAVIDDGRLEIVLVREISRWKLLRVFPRVFSGRHADEPEIVFHPATRVRVALERTLVAHGDGEPLLPVDSRGAVVEVAPGALRAVAPAIVRPGGARS